MFFNDRDIDDWWTSANVKEPPTTRKHNLADGFALVGINPKINVLALDGTKVVLNATGKTVDIKGALLNLLGATQSYVRGDDWKTAYDTFMNVLAAITPGTTIQNAAALTAIKNAAIAVLTQHAGILSATIKGE